MGRRKIGQKRSQRRGVRMGIHDRFLHQLFHLDTRYLGWTTSERIDEVLREDRRRLETEMPRIRGEREI